VPKATHGREKDVPNVRRLGVDAGIAALTKPGNEINVQRVHPGLLFDRQREGN